MRADTVPFAVDDFAAGPEALVQSVENLQEVDAHMDEQLARVDEMLKQMKIKS